MEKIRPTDMPEYNNHEGIIYFEDKDSGLRGFFVIHNTNCGPAVGGTRMYPYASDTEALADALRLSEAMTYKCALAGVPYGGGKAVIIGDPEKDKSEALLRAYARKVNELKGSFFTGEDVGLSEDDVQVMLTESKYFIGNSAKAGDPSPYAALSAFYSMQTAAGEVFGNEDLSGRSVAIKGVGKVGGELSRLLTEAGAKVYIADINDEALMRTKKIAPDAVIVDSDEISKMKVDIYAPCALGNEFTNDNVDAVNAKIICGGANNQLSTPEIGDILDKRSVLYVVDYIANSGGLINVVDELEDGGYNKKRVLERTGSVRDIVKKVIQRAKEQQTSTSQVSDAIAREIFNS
ncbi:Glu/Leu/Phe/Val dehydrogenase [Patescibacteria group bacterium]